MIEAPAPWHLSGKAYICFLRNRSFLMFVDYAHSPVGPYHELLFIPKQTGKFLSIERIFVSSMSSVINGRRNWGIPKEIAEFDVTYNEEGVDRIIVRSKGKVFAELAFKPWSFPLSIPLTTRIVPKSWRTLMQHMDNTSYQFCPEGTGWVQPARLIKATINRLVFPGVSLEDVLGTLKVTDFCMNFPKAYKT